MEPLCVGLYTYSWVSNMDRERDNKRIRQRPVEWTREHLPGEMMFKWELKDEWSFVR